MNKLFNTDYVEVDISPKENRNSTTKYLCKVKKAANGRLYFKIYDFYGNVYLDKKLDKKGEFINNYFVVPLTDGITEKEG